MDYKCFDKRSCGGVVRRAQSETLAMGYKSYTNSEIMTNPKLAEELHNPIIRKLQKLKVYSSFNDNIWSNK